MTTIMHFGNSILISARVCGRAEGLASPHRASKAFSKVAHECLVTNRSLDSPMTADKSTLPAALESCRSTLCGNAIPLMLRPGNEYDGPGIQDWRYAE